MILGLITTKDVLRHTRTIVREFGAATYLRCCLGVLRRRQTTFLECISPPLAQPLELRECRFCLFPLSIRIRLISVHQTEASSRMRALEPLGAGCPVPGAG